MKTLLVPTDFSATAQAALDVAASIAKKVSAKLMLLHVVEAPGSGSFNVEAQVAGPQDWDNKLFTMKLIQNGRAKLARLAEQTAAKGVDVTQLLRIGNPFHGMQDIVAEQNVDLIIMGTNGVSGFRELFIGSNTEKIVRRAGCPVLSIPSKQRNNEFKTIVYAASLQGNESGMLDIVKNTQAAFDSTVHLLRVN
ncbi:MAG TPA: universal stress protein, partial [Cyclobacteriaceae bacterium]|nr:universal stress protein [Cyclobacteriaceae bacterium]